tara:strand:+ start:12370 stop:13776 length:1407 start_codon:yes stop_codon:yes gene_type:complete
MGSEREQRMEDPMVFGRSFLEETLQPEWVHPESFSGALGFSIDSRRIEAGEIFVALKTERRDGHDFLGMALEKHAAAALVSEPQPTLPLPQIVVADTLRAFQLLGREWRKNWGGRLIAVTGSCGKTSTKEMLGMLLGEEDTYVTPGNLNNYLGIPLCELELRSHHRRAVLEAGISEKGEMDQLAAMLLPEISVVTTIAPAHLENLGSLDGVAGEKSVLAKYASEGAYFGPACARFKAFSEIVSPKGVQWVLPHVSGSEMVLPGTTWSYRVEKDLVSLHSKGRESVLLGSMEGTAGMIENACLAALVARDEGIPDEEIVRRLGSWKPATQRGEILTAGGRTIYADYYNANPSSVLDAAHYFDRRYPSGPRIWVVGGMEELGADGVSWHRDLAKVLPVRAGDSVFLVGGLSSEMAPDLREKVGEAGAVVVASDAASVVKSIGASQGPIFLKGSRKFHLETILDSLALTIN